MDNLFIPEYKVSELVKNIKEFLELSFGYIKVVGEISGLKISPLGHIYFNLKENNSIINAVLFKNNILNSNLVLEDGFEIVSYGKISTYLSKSNYQLIIESVRINGSGQLQKILEDRKKKLKEEGLFDNKKHIIKHIKQVGIITSPTGAAIRDIEIQLKKRLYIDVILFPSIVQGNEAEQNIIEGIGYFNNLDIKPDVIVITRGGGSFEDLMCFNSEKLAYSSFNSTIPIISAVGHEVDWTILDYVADLRLPTPTAVAEFISPLKINCEIKLNFIFKKIIKNILKILDSYKLKIDFLFRQIILFFIDAFLGKKNYFILLLSKFDKFDRNKILKQNYALILKNGRILSYNDELILGDLLNVKMYGGRIFNVEVIN